MTSPDVPAWATADGVTRSHLDLARDAIAAGDADRALALLDAAEARWRSLQDYSINWVTALLSWIGRTHGEAAVEDALRDFGDGWLADRRDVGDGPTWWSLPAEARARAVARSMVANGASVAITEHTDRIDLAFRCGTGGRLVDEGAYDGPGGHLVLRDPAPRTFGRDQLWAYCAHCSVNNELQPIESDGLPMTVEVPPRAPGEPCVHHVFRTPADVPDWVYAQLGRTPPDDGEDR